MKKNKQKIDKELSKQLLILVLGGIVLGGTLSTFMFYTICSILSLQLSLPIQIILGFLIGGGTTGVFLGASIKESLKNNNYEEDIYYEEYELEDEEEFGNKFVQENVPSLKIVKGSGSNYNYKFKEEERPKLELVNPNKDKNNKKR